MVVVSDFMSSTLAPQLAGLIAGSARPEAAAWFAAQLAAFEGPHARGDFVVAFSGAGRRLGTAPGDGGSLQDDRLRLLFGGRGLDEIGRAALLSVEIAGTEAGGHGALVNELFYRGEAREKQAVLRALSTLPDPARFLEVGVEACRSSVQTVFEAIACENPFPADHFSDLAFNQMVLKALFTATPVARIFGLAGRVTDELVRMAEGYGSERRAAGRIVPDDIARIAELSRRKP